MAERACSQTAACVERLAGQLPNFIPNVVSAKMNGEPVDHRTRRPLKNGAISRLAFVISLFLTISPVDLKQFFRVGEEKELFQKCTQCF